MRGIVGSALVLAIGIALGADIRSGVLGAIVIVLLSALFGVAYAGFAILVALRTRNVQATQSSFILFFPLLFLTPNFVPFNRLTAAMNTLAHINPISYVIVGLRSLVIDGWNGGEIIAEPRVRAPRAQFGPIASSASISSIARRRAFHSGRGERSA